MAIGARLERNSDRSLEYQEGLAAVFTNNFPVALTISSSSSSSSSIHE